MFWSNLFFLAVHQPGELWSTQLQLLPDCLSAWPLPWVTPVPVEVLPLKREHWSLLFIKSRTIQSSSQQNHNSMLINVVITKCITQAGHEESNEFKKQDPLPWKVVNCMKKFSISYILSAWPLPWVTPMPVSLAIEETTLVTAVYKKYWVG